ncbi:hypothetical protein KP79_PYT05028 [Mizuhopecten yessoensis]|uniref:HECT domain-containing protein n=1 Tax=Mizuhopecten yessoensis TaxID=6573 RepID=A0A210QJ34_MIZYE|nr:hypothetical protein KP79_PYT05028 [Mizuhopecten yessoensis]
MDPALSSDRQMPRRTRISFRRVNQLRLRRSRPVLQVSDEDESMPSPHTISEVVPPESTHTSEPPPAAPATVPEPSCDVDNDDGSVVGPSDLSLKGLLSWWIKQTLTTDEPVLMLIHRANILKSIMRIVSREDWNCCRPIKITFRGEVGDDLGGPKREFLRLLMKDMENEIQQGSTDGHFFLSRSQEALV